MMFHIGVPGLHNFRINRRGELSDLHVEKHLSYAQVLHHGNVAIRRANSCH